MSSEPYPHTCSVCYKKNITTHCDRCGARYKWTHCFIAPDETDDDWACDEGWSEAKRKWEKKLIEEQTKKRESMKGNTYVIGGTFVSEILKFLEDETSGNLHADSIAPRLRNLPKIEDMDKEKHDDAEIVLEFELARIHHEYLHGRATREEYLEALKKEREHIHAHQIKT